MNKEDFLQTLELIPIRVYSLNEFIENIETMDRECYVKLLSALEKDEYSRINLEKFYSLVERNVEIFKKINTVKNSKYLLSVVDFIIDNIPTSETKKSFNNYLYLFLYLEAYDLCTYIFINHDYKIDINQPLVDGTPFLWKILTLTYISSSGIGKGNIIYILKNTISSMFPDLDINIKKNYKNILYYIFIDNYFSFKGNKYTETILNFFFNHPNFDKVSQYYENEAVVFKLLDSKDKEDIKKAFILLKNLNLDFINYDGYNIIHIDGVQNIFKDDVISLTYFIEYNITVFDILLLLFCLNNKNKFYYYHHNREEYKEIIHYLINSKQHKIKYNFILIIGYIFENKFKFDYSNLSLLFTLKDRFKNENSHNINSILDSINE